MKIALIGYGKMGKEIERIALERGHQIACRIGRNSTDTFDGEAFKTADVAIEFTTPLSAYSNYMQCFKHGVPVVSGTTGWLDKIDEIKSMCENKGQTFFYASNFSLGVNLFFELNKKLASLMNKTEGYDVSIEEIHHIHKKDAPSGTAITLAEGIIENNPHKTQWTLLPENHETAVPIKAVREDEVPGTHTITYNSEVDEIMITHRAKSRQGFAIGAVLAAEFTATRKGFLGMNDLLNLR
jgi:4-hydroxy-tetrahydrodipicolinate reductase